MSDLVITLIGIITLSCGTPTQATPDPCAANLFPKAIEMIIPDGRFHSKTCKDSNSADPTVEPHEAFIRVRGARATHVTSWPGAIECNGLPKPCVLYPLVKRRLTISGVTSGDGAAITNLGDYPEIRWSTLFGVNPLQAPKLGTGPRIAQMTIDSGTITYDLVPGMNGAIGAHIKVPNPSGPTVIRAIGTSNVLEINVPDSAQIDIVNLPRYLALSHFPNSHVHDDCDHFFLHYKLAAVPPTMPCPLPDPKACTRRDDPPAAGATLSCSNSNYP